MAAPASLARHLSRAPPSRAHTASSTSSPSHSPRAQLANASPRARASPLAQITRARARRPIPPFPPSRALPRPSHRSRATTTRVGDPLVARDLRARSRARSFDDRSRLSSSGDERIIRRVVLDDALARVADASPRGAVEDDVVHRVSRGAERGARERDSARVVGVELETATARSTPRRGRVSARGRASAREGLGRRGRVARARGRGRARGKSAREGGGEVVMASVRTLRFDDVADDGDGDAREVATSSDDEDDVGLPVVVGGRRARAGVRRASSAVRAPAESDDEGEEDARGRGGRRRTLRGFVGDDRFASRVGDGARGGTSEAWMRSSARGNDARGRERRRRKGSRRWSWSCRWRENSRRRSWRVI